MIKENYMYVGIDLHKETHTAVIIDCYNQKLGEITFPNRPADFPKLVAKVKKCNTAGKEVVYGLENAYGYGRALAVWLIDKGYFVKDSSIYESKLKNNATNEQYTFIGLSIHECHKESLSNKIGITRLCNPLAYPASYNNHGDFLLSEVKQSIKISHCSI